MTTAGGVVFYSGTLDNHLRAYDVSTGRKLWQSRLPAGGHGSLGTTLGDTVLAYELR